MPETFYYSMLPEFRQFLKAPLCAKSCLDWNVQIRVQWLKGCALSLLGSWDLVISGVNNIFCLRWQKSSNREYSYSVVFCVSVVVVFGLFKSLPLKVPNSLCSNAQFVFVSHNALGDAKFFVSEAANIFSVLEERRKFEGGVGEWFLSAVLNGVATTPLLKCSHQWNVFTFVPIVLFSQINFPFCYALLLFWNRANKLCSFSVWMRKWQRFQSRAVLLNESRVDLSMAQITHHQGLLNVCTDIFVLVVESQVVIYNFVCRPQELTGPMCQSRSPDLVKPGSQMTQCGDILRGVRGAKGV